MPVPQTFAVGALGLATKWSARSMQTLRFPWPAPSPRTAEPSMYAFWLMSSLVFRVSTATLLERSEARMNTATFMPGRLDKLAGRDKWQYRVETDA